MNSSPVAAAKFALKTDINDFGWRSIKSICCDFFAGLGTVICDSGGARQGDGNVTFVTRSVVHILVRLRETLTLQV